MTRTSTKNAHELRRVRSPRQGWALALSALIAAMVLLLAGSCRSTPGPVAELIPEEPPVDPGWEVRFTDTSIEVELHEPFIKLVDLARLRVGMTKTEVLAIFPDPIQIELRGTDELWQYGFAELIFRGNRLRDWFNLE